MLNWAAENNAVLRGAAVALATSATQAREFAVWVKQAKATLLPALAKQQQICWLEPQSF